MPIEAPSTSDPVALLEAALRSAAGAALERDPAETNPLIRGAKSPELGDYQANGAMALAKVVGGKPRDIAQAIVDAAEADPTVSELVESLEIAGPGFINIRLRGSALADMLQRMSEGDLGVVPSDDLHAVTVDLCGVNVAKQMHVGHLRATIIGDALARVFERQGRTVHRENHLGDWGLPIAMVLQQLREAGVDLDALTVDALDRAYRDAQLTCKADKRGLAAAHERLGGPHRIAELEEQNMGALDALEAAKTTLVALQGGDAELKADWQRLIDCTLRALYEALDILGVNIGPEHNRGESTYRSALPEVVDAFVREGIATEDDGALVVRFPDRERPMLIRKSDGGFLYATTDLAAIRFRVRELDSSRVIYVVDARQRDHFRDVFDAARLAGWHTTEDGTAAELFHVPFGSVLGPDKRPLKTRSGDNVTLISLLEEAVERGTKEVRARAEAPEAPTHGLPDDELAAIGRAVGIGAIKYADLSNDLVRDYVFDFDRMIRFEGDTGPYLQYAHARVCSLFRKAGIDPATLDGPLMVEEVQEKQLAILLLKYGSVVDAVARTLELHRLCAYLFELSGAFSAFWQHCPVLKLEDDVRRTSRLRLCDLTRRVLADGLGMLGIDAPDRM
ncbi:MAG: arginine--tRNA ligase [Planctomycetota bacterium]|jgi:arginyl-tRNA synthetase